jgi:hypothetical protein
LVLDKGKVTQYGPPHQVNDLFLLREMCIETGDFEKLKERNSPRVWCCDENGSHKGRF